MLMLTFVNVKSEAVKKNRRRIAALLTLKMECIGPKPEMPKGI